MLIIKNIQNIMEKDEIKVDFLFSGMRLWPILLQMGWL
jgi:hypothetical protein